MNMAKKKIDTAPNTYFRNRFTTDKLLDKNGCGFEIRALKHKEFAFMQANARNDMQMAFWAFRLGVVALVGLKDENGVEAVLFQETFKDPLGGDIRYMGDAQFENLDVNVVATIAAEILKLSKLSAEDTARLFLPRHPETAKPD